MLKRFTWIRFWRLFKKKTTCYYIIHVKKRYIIYVYLKKYYWNLILLRTCKQNLSVYNLADFSRAFAGVNNISGRHGRDQHC